MTTSSFYLNFGTTLHYCGMVFSRHIDPITENCTVRVQWLHVPGAPVCFLNYGDGAYNYNTGKMVTVEAIGHNGIVIDITGAGEVILCCVGTSEYAPEYYYHNNQSRKTITRTIQAIKFALWSIGTEVFYPNK